MPQSEFCFLRHSSAYARYNRTFCPPRPHYGCDGAFRGCRARFNVAENDDAADVRAAGCGRGRLWVGARWPRLLPCRARRHRFEDRAQSSRVGSKYRPLEQSGESGCHRSRPGAAHRPARHASDGRGAYPVEPRQRRRLHGHHGGTAAIPDAAAPSNGIALIWPTAGKIARGFDGVNSKGIDIVNAPGTPVVAAAAGTVVYAGNGLRGYGELLIIKHNADFLTAYAHNRKLLVKEGESVAQGQAIAEMGDTDNDRVALHFELRYAGRSIDPSRYLPGR